MAWYGVRWRALLLHVINPSQHSRQLIVESTVASASSSAALRVTCIGCVIHPMIVENVMAAACLLYRFQL